MFFQTFHAILVKDHRVTEMTAVPDAHVPVIKFVFDGIDFDLTFSQLAYAVIPPNFNVFDDSHLNNIDKKSELSLNGQLLLHFTYIYRCYYILTTRSGAVRLNTGREELNAICLPGGFLTSHPAGLLAPICLYRYHGLKHPVGRIRMILHTYIPTHLHPYRAHRARELSA